MLLCFLGGLALCLGWLVLAAAQVVRRHKGQCCAVVRLSAGLSCRQLEGALRELYRQSGGFRRVYLVDRVAAAEQRRLLLLLCRELGFYLLDLQDIKQLEKQEVCRQYVLARDGGLHRYKG